jgi:lipopolysaccharide biosynthesis glycosyltransferase
MDGKLTNKAIEIAFAATGDYAPMVLTTMLSIVENTHEHINFHILAENFQDKDKFILKDFLYPFDASVEFINIESNLKIFKGAQRGWFKSYIIYARILIPELIACSKVIYMDADIIVNYDIKELWDIDLHCNDKEYPLAASIDVSVNKEAKNILKKIQLAPNHQYFNSGVLIINGERWREEKITQRIVNIVKDTTLTFKFPDQDALNIYFDNNNYLLFEGEYNSSPFFAKQNGEKCKQKCYHYLVEKPWADESVAEADIFWNYAKRTPYYEQLQTLLKENIAKKILYKQKLKEFTATARQRIPM